MYSCSVFRKCKNPLLINILIITKRYRVYNAQTLQFPLGFWQSPRGTGTRSTVLQVRKTLKSQLLEVLGPLQSLSFLDENSALQRVLRKNYSKYF